MIGITGHEIMNADLKNVQVRRCVTCGEIMGPGHTGPCSKCKGFVVTLGPIGWAKEDEVTAMKDLDEQPWEDEEEFQNVVCLLWDKIDACDKLIDEQDKEMKGLEAEVEGLEGEIVIHKNAVKMAEKEIKELKAKLADKSLKGKVKKSFGVTK